MSFKFRGDRLLVAFVLGLGACAYHLKRGGLSRGAGETVDPLVFVPVVDNLTTEVGPEAVLTSAVREAMASIDGLKVVNREDGARYILLGHVKDWGRRFGTATGVASLDDELRGGLVRNQTTAADIKVFLVADFELLEALPTTGLGPEVRKSVWKRTFRSEANFEASNRFEELTGASSAPQINRSRERLQLRKMSESMARQIIDQVSQDF